MTEVVLYGKAGCHLCDDARTVVDRVLADFPDVAFEERSILDDEALSAAYAEEIPVVLVDGRVHTIWRVNDDRLRKALAGTSA